MRSTVGSVSLRSETPAPERVGDRGSRAWPPGGCWFFKTFDPPEPAFLPEVGSWSVQGPGRRDRRDTVTDDVTEPESVCLARREANSECEGLEYGEVT